jgi:hypothetical protein
MGWGGRGGGVSRPGPSLSGTPRALLGRPWAVPCAWLSAARGAAPPPPSALPPCRRAGWDRANHGGCSSLPAHSLPLLLPFPGRFPAVLFRATSILAPPPIRSSAPPIPSAVLAWRTIPEHRTVPDGRCRSMPCWLRGHGGGVFALRSSATGPPSDLGQGPFRGQCRDCSRSPQGFPRVSRGLSSTPSGGISSTGKFAFSVASVQPTGRV